MAKKKKAPSAAKLLDAWRKPEHAGDAIGCAASSFTFSPAFFEEECLTRFVGLERDPATDGAAYLIEQEEKLRQLQCAAALVDGHNACGMRSLRWDLVPVRMERGVMHAKVALLCWANQVRLIVGSANLTQPGYRRNLEGFAVLDYTASHHGPRECLVEFIALIESLAPAESEAPGQRLRALLQHAGEIAMPFSVPSSGPVRVLPLIVRPGQTDALTQLRTLWPAASPPTRADVLSPFFDPPDAPNAPARRLWETLRQRGDAEVHWVLAGDEPGADGKIPVHAPRSLVDAQPKGRAGVASMLHKAEMQAGRELHAKMLRISTEDACAYMVGSSNFTSAALGLSSHTNIEANIVYVAKGPVAAELDAFPERQLLDPESVVWQAVPNTDEQSADCYSVLPAAFGHAILHGHEGAFVLHLHFTASPRPGWVLCPEDGDDPLLHEATWRDAGSPSVHVTAWPFQRPPSGLRVLWPGDERSAYWPVHLATGDVLPLPEQLRHLPLEVLLEHLTSARPLHDLIERHKIRIAHGGKDRDLLDPHKRVNTSGFMLQRTRRMSAALAELRRQLARPVHTEDALQWRLYGPLGPRAIASALQSDRKSPEEAAFLLAELVLELHRTREEMQPGRLDMGRVKQEMDMLIGEISSEAQQALDELEANMQAYVRKAVESVRA